MKYKVLYRKYRPDNFENVVGQDYIVTTLKNSILNGTVSHAYLFSGPRGTGKTSTAKIFAKAVNCLSPENGSPCGKCEFCTNFKDNPDIIEMDAASNRGVNEIRSIIDNVKLTPTNGKYKVYIIDEAHMLTDEAFNALLLTLEEPPNHVIFILATTNVENVPITILSRCQRFDFQKIKVDDIVKALKNISNQENIDIEDDALTEIAYLSEGGMRDALSLLDQLSKLNEKITLKLIEQEVKVVSQQTVINLIDSIEHNDINAFLTIFDNLRNSAVDYKNLVKRIIDIISKKALNLKKSFKSSNLNFEDYKKIIFELSNTLVKTNINVDNYTIMEMILLNYFNVINSENNPSKVEKSIESVKFKEVESNTLIDDNFINIRINNCFVNAKKNYLESAKTELENLISNYQIDGNIKTILLDSNVVAASQTNLIFTCNNNHNVDKANKLLEEIEKYYKNELKKDYKIVFLTTDRWIKEKEKYIENIKMNKTYSYIQEKDTKNNEEESIVKINDVFNQSKVEII